MKSYAVRLVAIAALASGLVLADCRPTPAQAKASAPAGATQPRAPLVLVQAAPAGPSPAREQPVGLPPVKDYEPMPELRDIYFDMGTAAIRAGDVKTLLTNCEDLRFQLGKRNTQPGTLDQFPAAEANEAKVVDVSWKCYREILGVKANTEAVQTAKIVIRRQGT